MFDKVVFLQNKLK